MNNLLLMIAFFLLPLVMVLVGMRYAKKPPKRINRLSGYRTRRSMRNWDTWSFAHMYLGDLWFKVGVPLLAITSVVSLVVFRTEEESKLVFWCYVVVAIQLLLMLIPVYYTEKALKERFDEKGKWHKEDKAKWEEELEKRRAREEEEPQERKERRKREKAQSKQPEQLPAETEQPAAAPQPDGQTEQDS